MNKAIVVEDLESLIKRGRFAVIFQTCLLSRKK